MHQCVVNFVNSWRNYWSWIFLCKSSYTAQGGGGRGVQVNPSFELSPFRMWKIIARFPCKILIFKNLNHLKILDIGLRYIITLKVSKYVCMIFRIIETCMYITHVDNNIYSGRTLLCILNCFCTLLKLKLMKKWADTRHETFTCFPNAKYFIWVKE